MPAAQYTQAPAVGSRVDKPFDQIWVTLTKREHIELVMDAQYWKVAHQRAVAREQWLELQKHQLLASLTQYKAQLRSELEQALALQRQSHQQQLQQGAQQRAELQAQLDVARAQIRDLRQRVFGRKSECSKGANQAQSKGCHKPKSRGQPYGQSGHGRTTQAELPQRHETRDMATPQCPKCGLDLQALAGSEDSSVVEIEVKAYRRVIHRKRYQRVCTCSGLKTIFAASVEPKLIAHGKYGVSVWTEILLSKFSHGQPSHRLLQDLASHGLIMSAGTLAGGLQKIAALFEPINKALLARLRTAKHWHADETRWATFIEVEAKVGHRWYLWVFHSAEVVHYVLDKSRATHVIEAELAGVVVGIISCDRYSAYKRFMRLHPGIELAFCWVHQRRDFLQLANSYPELSAWAFEWVDAIGELYHLNDLRLQTVVSSPERTATQSHLDIALQGMADRARVALLEPKLAVACVKVLTSMQVHWQGLTVFARCPWVSMDNNTAERDMRGPVVGRKNFFGSGSLWSGQLACTMYSLLATLKLYGINERIWLGDFLQACADRSGQALGDVSAFMPWSMSARQLAHMRGAGLSKSKSKSRAKVHGRAAAAASVPEEVNSS